MKEQMPECLFPPTTHPRYLDALIALELGYWGVGIYEGELVHGDNTMNGWPQNTPRFMDEIRQTNYINRS
jgi:hypothetical protein